MPEVNTENLHKLRAKLYPNYLPGVQGKYFARSSRVETPLDVLQVCKSAKERGRYTGTAEDLAAAVRVYHKESVHLRSKDVRTILYPVDLTVQ